MSKVGSPKLHGQEEETVIVLGRECFVLHHFQ
jgi:hypothetical protein